MNQDSYSDRRPKTARGRRTREKLLTAAEQEFGEKGFYAVGISDLTRRAGVAAGTFYVYFESKEEIFRALVFHLSQRVRSWVGKRAAGAPDRLTAERLGLEAFLEFTREHPGLYRIISESEFIANDAFMAHYSSFARAYHDNLEAAGRRGEIREGDYEVWSWAIMGMMVYLGMRFAEWDDKARASEVAQKALDLIGGGLARRD